MGRYVRIQSVTFGQTELLLPLSVRLSRHSEASPARSDNDLFATSIEIVQPALVAEVRIRDTAVAEDLSLGQQGDLSFTVCSTTSGGSSRVVELSDAVLVSVELAYEQSAMATALLRFVAESDDGAQEPFSAENEQ